MSAYKLEQAIVYPVIGIDKKIIERLRLNFSENAEGLFYQGTLLFSNSEPEIIFLNPFDFLDNSIKYFNYIESTLDNLIKFDEENEDDEFSRLTTSMLKLANSFTRPIFDYAKSQITPENMNAAKEKVLEYVIEQLKKYNEMLLRNELDSKIYKDIKKIIVKYEHLTSLTEWSMGRTDAALFNYYEFT